MSRGPRIGSQSGIYHIMFRGVNHCHIFEENSDYQKFINYFTRIKKEIDFLFFYTVPVPYFSSYVRIFP